MAKHKKYIQIVLIFSLLLFLCSLGTIKGEAKEKREFVVKKGVLIKYTGAEKEIVIPDDVKEIGKKVFQNNQTITTVVISKNVKTIGDKAFYNCKRLKTVILQEGVRTIGEEAFYHCISIKNIQFPKTIKIIKDSAFEKCKKLSGLSFPDTTIFFGECVFSGIKRGNGGEFGEYVIANKNTLIQYIESAVEREIKLPDTIRAIQTEAFSLAGEVYKITVPGSVAIIQQGIFGAVNAEEIILTEGTEELEDSAFEDCEVLERIAIPESVTIIGENLFSEKVKDSIVIACRKNSVAYKYAKKNGYMFEVTSE